MSYVVGQNFLVKPSTSSYNLDSANKLKGRTVATSGTGVNAPSLSASDLAAGFVIVTAANANDEVKVPTATEILNGLYVQYPSSNPNLTTSPQNGDAFVLRVFNASANPCDIQDDTGVTLPVADPTIIAAQTTVQLLFVYNSGAWTARACT